MSEAPKSDPNLEVINFLLSSFTDNGRSLRAFTTNPQELAIRQISIRYSRQDSKARWSVPIDAVCGQYRQCFCRASPGHRARLGD